MKSRSSIFNGRRFTSFAEERTALELNQSA
jgi:hypothetical protein